MTGGEVKSAAENLDKIYRSLSDKDFFLGLSGEALAYTAVKIAALKARLVEVKREAELNAKVAETNYKSIKAAAYRRLIEGDGETKGVSATAASLLVYDEKDVYEARNDMAEAQALWNFIKSLVADGHDMVDAIRSRLIDLQSSRKDESIK